MTDELKQRVETLRDRIRYAKQEYNRATLTISMTDLEALLDAVERNEKERNKN